MLRTVRGEYLQQLISYKFIIVILAYAYDLKSLGNLQTKYYGLILEAVIMCSMHKMTLKK